MLCLFALSAVISQVSAVIYIDNLLVLGHRERKTHITCPLQLLSPVLPLELYGIILLLISAHRYRWIFEVKKKNRKHFTWNDKI